MLMFLYKQIFVHPIRDLVKPLSTRKAHALHACIHLGWYERHGYMCTSLRHAYHAGVISHNTLRHLTKDIMEIITDCEYKHVKSPHNTLQVHLLNTGEIVDSFSAVEFARGPGKSYYRQMIRNYGGV